MKAIGRATKVMSKTANQMQSSWLPRISILAFLKGFKWLYQIKDLLSDFKARLFYKIYNKF